MELKLIVCGGKNAGQAIPVSGRKFFIGRAEDCNLRPHSDLVSRHHCVILLEEGFVAVRDFGSKNGTYLNGERIRAEQELKKGDHLKVGDLEFEVELSVEVGGKKKPKVHSVQEAAARTAQSSKQSDGFDVNHLVEEDTGPLAADAETQTLVMPQSQPQPVTPPPPPAPVAPLTAKTQTPAQTEEDEKEKIDVAAAWKGVKKKPEAPSSREAAASMLKHFFKGH